MHTDDSTHRIEHINKQESENHYQHIKTEHLTPLKLTEYGSNTFRCRYKSVQLGYRFASRGIFDYQTNHCGEQDSPENTATYPGHHQTGGNKESEHSQKGSTFGNMSKTYKCCIVIYDDARVLHANKGDEQADTCSDGFIQRSWNSLQYQATHLGDSKNNEDDTFQQHGGEGKLPGVSHAKTYGIYKECVKTHARSQCERLLGIDRHY